MSCFAGITNHVISTMRTHTAVFAFLVLVPLLAPKGLESMVPGYKAMMTAWAVVSLFLMFLLSIDRLRREKCASNYSLGFITYYLVAILVTIFSEKGITSGLQELLLYPMGFFFILNSNQDELNIAASVSSIILIFLFGAKLFLSPFLNFDFHMTLLGHIQVFSQYGLLALYLANLILKKKLLSRRCSVVLVLLAVTGMLTEDVDSARYCLVVFLAAAVLMRFIPSLRLIDCRLLILVLLLANGIIVALTVTRLSPLMATSFDWSFSGRYFIWESAWQIIQASPVFGVGVENAVMTTFWSSGMSYAHNQVVQCLVDGGIVLLASMIWLLCSVGKSVNNIKDVGMKSVSIAVLCSVLFTMIFDSFSIYSYVFLLLAFIAREGLDSEVGPMGFSSIKQKFSQFYYARRIRKIAADCAGKIYTGGKSYVTPNTHLGDNVCFNGMAMSGSGRITVGSNFHSGPGCQIITSFHDYDCDDAIPYGNHMIDKDVTIGDNVWLGNNVIILGGVTIGEGAIVQAGSVVCKDIPAYSVAGGHPATPFKQRDVEHYEELKRLGRFH
ncbi:O-antigen ligase family protein [Paratractidigestivibacter faecalis]|uniref:O-antigen ligase family protein n=1 Tax=Paratractidigestivibacter faecalis TaxID=2292441 RepID=UPI003F9E57CF